MHYTVMCACPVRFLRLGRFPRREMTHHRTFERQGEVIGSVVLRGRSSPSEFPILPSGTDFTRLANVDEAYTPIHRHHLGGAHHFTISHSTQQALSLGQVTTGLGRTPM